MAPDTRRKAPIPVDGTSQLSAAIDEQICRQCAGMCCQGHPGLWVAPSRFAAIFFAGRNLTLTLLQKELPRFELELRRIGNIPVPAPRRSSAGCAFLGARGCTLDAERRPCQCLALVPSIDTLLDGEIRCHMPQGYGSGEARLQWERFWAHQSRPGTIRSHHRSCPRSGSPQY